MRLLTSENTVFLMETLPTDGPLKVKPCGGDYIHFCVLDYTLEEPDFMFPAMYSWGTFPAPGITVEVGAYEENPADPRGPSIWQADHTLLMPLDWHILVGDASGELENMALAELNDRDFLTPVFNPLNSNAVFTSDYKRVRCTQVFSQVPWSFPIIKKGQVLVVPLTKEPGAPCLLMPQAQTPLLNNVNTADFLAQDPGAEAWARMAADHNFKMEV